MAEKLKQFRPPRKKKREAMNIPIYQVDAFTSEVFSGNPAAICLLDCWLDDPILQAIAAENNLSETAFSGSQCPRL